MKYLKRSQKVKVWSFCKVVRMLQRAGSRSYRNSSFDAKTENTLFALELNVAKLEEGELLLEGDAEISSY